MSLKALIIPILILTGVLVVALNTGFLADKALEWASKNPDRPEAPQLVYRVARWCDLTGDDQNAVRLYLQIYERFPERRELAAESIYRAALAVSYGTARRQASNYLDLLFREYPEQEKWRSKGKELWDVVNKIY